ncbi:hypothetical protein CFP56_039549 [Quercus suber]|uniref:Uncharacterized protein n=1 Tax=Quercus suber TaxID=58331 RepID=A0AAW0IZZ5_QUESU
MNSRQAISYSFGFFDFLVTILFHLFLPLIIYFFFSFFGKAPLIIYLDLVGTVLFFWVICLQTFRLNMAFLSSSCKI